MKIYCIVVGIIFILIGLFVPFIFAFIHFSNLFDMFLISIMLGIVGLQMIAKAKEMERY